MTKTKTPVIIWLVRLLLSAVGFFFAYTSWKYRQLGICWQQIVVISLMLLCGLTLYISFRRSISSLYVTAVFVIIFPLMFFVLVNMMLRGAWWEWLIAIPMQMGIPVTVAFYLWKAPNVREFYSPKGKPAPESP